MEIDNVWKTDWMSDMTFSAQDNNFSNFIFLLSGHEYITYYANPESGSKGVYEKRSSYTSNNDYYGWLLRDRLSDANSGGTVRIGTTLICEWDANTMLAPNLQYEAKGLFGFLMDGLGVYNSQISPALNLDLSKIVLSTPTDITKGGNYGTPSSAYANAQEWDLTLLGGEKIGLTHNAETTMHAGVTNTVSTTVTAIGTPDTGVAYDQLSAMLVDESTGNVIYYGKIGAASAGVKYDFTLPSELTPGFYSIRVFAEDINGATYVDYASEPYVIDFELGAEVKVINNQPETMISRTSTSGAAEQFTSSSITPIIYKVTSDDYYFSDQYASVGTYNGITVARDETDWGQLTISGSPLADVEITLAKADEKKDNDNIPDFVQGSSELLVYTDSSMEYSMSPTSGQWTDCTSSQTTVACGGYYYVRYASTKETKASEWVKVWVDGRVYVNVIVPDNSNIIVDSGDLEREYNGAQEMEEVVLKAADGYYFPSNYSAPAGSGVTVTWVDASTIKVWGTPVATVTITLNPATEKGGLEPPNVTGGVLKIYNTDTTMEYATDANAVSWTTCDYPFTEVEAGTYYVRRKAFGVYDASASVIAEVTGVLSVTIIEPESNPGFTRLETTGDPVQTGLVGSMDVVMYKVEEGYYFPEDYSITTFPIDSGITVTVNNAQYITISGTPKDDITVYLETAWTKIVPDAPAVAGGEGGIQHTTSDMVYAISESSSIWYPCIDGETPAGGGTWYVKYKATDTSYESACTEVTVTGIARTVEIIEPSNSGLEHISGSIKQTGVTGEMIEVVYEAAAGYYFPESYSVSVGNGIVVRRDSDTQITVYGSPGTDVKIYLVAASKTVSASAVSLTVNTPYNTYIYWDGTSGGRIQDNLEPGDSITEIIFDADKDYYFPSDYELLNTTTNGITVTRISDSQIKITGNITADTVIDLVPASLRVGIVSYNVIVSLPVSPNMDVSKYSVGGPMQFGVVGAIDDVTILANYGYYFPSSYKVETLNGISVTRNNDGQITVSGTPTADTVITLIAPSVDVSGYSVSIKDPVGLNITKVAGDDNQSGVIGDMTTVIYKAEPGYYFPGDYTNQEINGVIVERIDDNYIRVYGTPTANTDIYLFPADMLAGDVEEVEGYDITIHRISTSNVEYDYPNGDESQKIEYGEAMTPVRYTANEGYYFPDNYAPQVYTTGVSVAVIDAYTIEVSGTPTGDVTIVLQAASWESGVVPEPELSGYSVDIVNPSGSNITKTHGDDSQPGITTSMEYVEYTANKGYYFPEDYVTEALKDVSGISVTWVSESKIIVTGTPTADVVLVLEAASLGGTVVDTYSVRITNTDANIILMPNEGNGKDYQTDLTGHMTDVYYTVEDGYEFPGGYTVGGSAGITVEKISSTQIRVTGTPTGHASIVLQPATKIEGSGTEDAVGFIVNIINPAGSNINWVSGGTTQTCIDDAAMSTVTFTPAKDYEFPEGYSITTETGISAEVVDGNLVVTGTPTADTFITLVALGEDDKVESDDEVPTEKYDVVIVNASGNNITHNSLSGDTSQYNISNYMDSVVYIAAEGYYFPSGETVATVDDVAFTSGYGVSVVRNSDEQITIFGQPTADLTIHLEAASLDDREDEPSTEEEKNTFLVKIVNPENSNIEWVSGRDVQEIESGSITDVVYEPAIGYTFPSDYSVDSSNGIEAMVSDGKLIVHGAPTANATIVLVPLKEPEIEVPTPQGPFTVTIKNLAGDTVTLIEGKEIQDDVSGYMDLVVFYVADGYWFPTDYMGMEINGIKVERASGSTVTVTGAPTADTTVILYPATLKDLPDLPPDFAGYDVEVKLPTNGSIELSVGSGTQDGVTASIDRIYYVAAEGYYFPEDYVSIGENGVVVTRLSSTTIMVSGTPTGNVSFYLESATYDVDDEYKDKKEGYYVTIENPSDSGIVPSSGSSTQVAITGAITEVTYVAAEGYYFPAGYTITEVNGITVTRVSSTKIVVSGTPTDDTIFKLVAATEGDDPDADDEDDDDDDDGNNGGNTGDDGNNGGNTGGEEVGDEDDDDDDDGEEEFEYPDGVDPDGVDPFDKPVNPTPEPDLPEDPEDYPDVDIDVDGDGIPDINIDTDGDGLPDVNVDTTGDGKPNINIDTDNTGTWLSSANGGNADGIWKPDMKIDSAGSGKGIIAYFTDAIDANGDGVDDRWIPDRLSDYDGDGVADYDTTLGFGINIDTNGDGKADLNVDIDGDGEADLNIDTDGDRKPDLNIDTDGDGIPDVNVDTDGDGIPDENIDTDGDGVADDNITAPGTSNWSPSGGVQTGDATSVFVYIWYALASLMGLALLVLKKRQKYNR